MEMQSGELKIIKINKLSKLPKAYRIAPYADEEDAILWAKDKGADKLYKFVRTKGIMWVVEEK